VNVQVCCWNGNINIKIKIYDTKTNELKMLNVNCCEFRIYRILTHVWECDFCNTVFVKAVFSCGVWSIVIVCVCAVRIASLSRCWLQWLCSILEVGRYFWPKISAISISFTAALFGLFIYFIITSKVVSDINVMS